MNKVKTYPKGHFFFYIYPYLADTLSVKSN